MIKLSPYQSRKIAELSFLAFILVVFIDARTADIMVPKSGPVYSTNFIIQNFIGDGIARVAVPLFFAFSGFLFFASLTPTMRGFKKKLSSRVRTIVVPYLAWDGLGLLLLFIVQAFHGNSPLSGEKLIGHYSVIDFLSRLYPHPVQFQFWFLLDLAVYLVLSPLLYFLLKRAGAAVPIGLALLYFSTIYRIPLYISDAALHPEGMLFFSTGAWIAVRKVRLPALSVRALWALSLAWVGLCIGKTFFLLYNGETYGYNLLHRAALIMGVVCVWRLYDLLPEKLRSGKWWKRLLSCTFFIYAFHEPAQTIIRNEIVRAIGAGPAVYSLCFVVCPLLTIALAIALARFLQKYTPGVFSLLTGGRGKNAKFAVADSSSF